MTVSRFGKHVDLIFRKKEQKPQGIKKNVRIHCMKLREIVKTVLVYLSITYWCLLNLPHNEKQSKKWMVTSL